MFFSSEADFNRYFYDGGAVNRAETLRVLPHAFEISFLTGSELSRVKHTLTIFSQVDPDSKFTAKNLDQYFYDGFFTLEKYLFSNARRQIRKEGYKDIEIYEFALKAPPYNVDGADVVRPTPYAAMTLYRDIKEGENQVGNWIYHDDMFASAEFRFYPPELNQLGFELRFYPVASALLQSDENNGSH